ncbi:AraC family transcriptional regulator [Clostridium sp. AN503]|uniref:helix-turn-helix transcriptional regulator n=1 Tax=Clostridium sp. AN503 TaxID=3160598 RepID=UPI00345780E2
MEKYGPFYYYEVDSDHYFKIAHLNELLIGQDKAQIQGIWASHAKTLPVQLDNLYLCIGGLPRAIYRTFYGCNASRYMNIINAVKQEMASILHKHRCHGELFLFNYGQKQIVLLYSPSGGDTPDHHEIARQFSGQILAAYKKQLYEDQEQLQPFTVYSEKITDFEDISRTYDRMLQIHALNFFVNEPWVISVDDPRFHQNPVPYNDLLLILDLLKHAVMDRDESQAGLCIRQLFDKIRLSLNQDYLQDILHEIKSLMFKVAKTYQCSEAGIRSSCQLEKSPTLHALADALCSQMERLLLEAKKHPRLNPLTQKVIGYIQIHYREDITLPLLAKKVHVAPNYLSRVFNQDMGMSIPVYTNHVRIENAARLLQDDGLRISDVAFQAGFSDPHHFTRIFKKKYGMTPTAYRESFHKNV